jgi:ureidoglycolate hydrolase
MTPEPTVLQVEPISAEAFAPYGDLLETPVSGTRQDRGGREPPR